MGKDFKTTSTFFSDLTEGEIKSSLYQGAIAAEFIRQRKERKMTQNEFAELLNVSQGMISKWESLSYNITVSSLIEIFEKLDVDVDILLDGKSLLKSKNKTPIIELYKRSSSKNWIETISLNQPTGDIKEAM